MIKKLFKNLSELEQIEAIALGGSRAGENFDKKSDYDVYLYCKSPVDENVRRKILSKYCSKIEIGNHFWEYEDNCTLKNDIDIDLLYRNLDEFCDEVASVAEKHIPHNGYTTCMWHNLINSKIICDESGRLKLAQKRFNIPYPEELKNNIIKRNMDLICYSMPCYRGQILKAVNRGDIISVNHKTSAFFESYFDVLFALNKLTHPGEKRLIQLCKNKCEILPCDFEENIEKLFYDLYNDRTAVEFDIDKIIYELKRII